MASQPESKIPGPGGGGGGFPEKRRSFLPAPRRSTGIPVPSGSASSVAAEEPVAAPKSPVALLKESAKEKPAEVGEVIPGAEKLRVDERILISGVKPGILRYVGKTHIAPGFWCGIELFDASGLHDGEVDGKRYFSCKPFRGIFAPVDKVFPDESFRSSQAEEKQAQVVQTVQEIKQDDKCTLETQKKSSVLDQESSKIPAPAKSQIARLSGIPRMGSIGQDKGVVKSKSSDAVSKDNSSKIATLSKKSFLDQNAGLNSDAELNSTFVVDGSVSNSTRLEDSNTGCSLNQLYSPEVEKHLHSDSRRYFNITFNKDNPPTFNLPDVVSSASPSPPRETASRPIPGTLNKTQSAQDIASSIASDISLGLIEPDVIADETNLLEGIISEKAAGRSFPCPLNKTQSAQDIASSIASDISLGLIEPDVILDETDLLEGIISEKVASSTSESDVSQSGNSSTLEEASVATVHEAFGLVLNSTPTQGGNFKKFLDENTDNLSDNLSDCESGRPVSAKATASVKHSLAQTFTAVAQGESAHRKDSSSSISGATGRAADLLQEEGSNGVSPEVSQVLEWDYDHDTFDGKLLEKCHDGMSTSTSDTCSDASAEPGLAEKIITDMEAAVQDSEEANQFEEVEDGFENIDSIEDFPLGMSKEPKLMTDSGISEKGFLEPAADTGSKRKSMELDGKISAVASFGQADNEREIAVDSHLQTDLLEGHTKQERPLSLVSTTSADTGYVPDTDSETGTLTTNSPTEWTEKQLKTNLASTNPDCRKKVAVSVKCKQSLISRGLPEEPVKEVETDGDVCCDPGTPLVRDRAELSDVDDPAGKAADVEESEDSEDDDDEEVDETSEEESSGDEEEEEKEADERPEDDRIEADTVAPSGDNSRVAAARVTGSAMVRDGASTALTDMSGSAVVGSEMTESTDPVVDDSASGDIQNASAISSKAPGNASHTERRSSEVGGGGDCNPPQKRRSSSKILSTSDRKIVAEHKKVVKSASSKLADYIKAPLPPAKPKEEKKAEGKAQKNKADSKRSKQQGGSPSPAADKSKSDVSEEKGERRPSRVKEEKPKVKRTVIKSKWGNIMSQIEANKDTVKVKPKAEIKSSLAQYLSSPATPTNNISLKKEKEAVKQKEEQSKSKTKLVKHPKPDFSNIKSKLHITSPSRPAKPPEISNNPNIGNPDDSKTHISGNPHPKEPGTRSALPRNPVVSILNGKLHVGRQETLENCSTFSQGTGSFTDLSLQDGADGSSPPGPVGVDKKRSLGSCAGSRLKNEASPSLASSRSDISTAQRNVKTMKVRNAQRSESHHQNNVSQGKKSGTAKSSLSPATPRKAGSQTAAPLAGQKEAPARPGFARTPVSHNSRPTTSLQLRSDMDLLKELKQMKCGGTPFADVLVKACQSRARTFEDINWKVGIVTFDQNKSRSRLGGGLKSGQPPDVVSNSARGTRAQEVARLESLCEARTKELNYTKMQLKAGLQAFDAMTCLLKYCTDQLDAFSCPMVTAQLHAAEDKLTKQQQSIESLNQQKSQLDQQLQEVAIAKNAAEEEVAKLKQEMTLANEAHSAAQQKLKEDHELQLKAQLEELSSQHQQAIQNLQKYQEKQAEYSHQSYKRQLSELTAEHQMDINQLKLAHLEEIQELRNKHDIQMEELHAQHRNKLEDITRRFESIKQSLSEKVQSLCVECDELRIRARTSEDALQRDADVKVQLALAPYLNLPREIEGLRTVIDMRTEEIQKLRRQNMDLEKQLEELPIAQEKVISLQQKVENLQAIINIKTDHEKQLHEKCQVLMRKYDRESRANKRLSMDYEQVVWRMSQSADLGSLESLSTRQVSRSPSRDHQSHNSPSPVKRTDSANPGDGSGIATVTRRQRRISGGDEDYDRKMRCRSATFSLDKSKSLQLLGDGDSDVSRQVSDPGVSSKEPRSSAKVEDYTEMIVAALSAENDETFSSGHESGDGSFLDYTLESRMILETPQGLSFNLCVADRDGETGDTPSKQENVIVEEEGEAVLPSDANDHSEDMADISCH